MEAHRMERVTEHRNMIGDCTSFAIHVELIDELSDGEAGVASALEE